LPGRDLEKLLRKAVKLTLMRMRANMEAEVSLVLTDDEGIQKLNKQYRGLDRPTDVLSFAQEDSKLLGDIVISQERAGEQAGRYGHSIEREMAFLTVHGMLHLLGLDHETAEERARMEMIQKQILAVMGLKREKAHE